MNKAEHYPTLTHIPLDIWDPGKEKGCPNKE